MKIKATYSVDGGRKILWGLVFILSAVLIVLDALNVIPDIPIVKLIFAGLFVFWAVYSLIKLRFTQFFFPLAFAFMILEGEIAPFVGKSGNLISNWLLLLVALFLTIGCHLIFGGKNFKFSKHINISHSTGDKNSFGEGVKYIDCADFEGISVKNSFGEYHVRFQNVELYEGGATLSVHNGFGETNIYVPSHWTVKFNVKPSFGAANCPVNVVENGPVLNITGNCSFGEVNVLFV
ncbi:MAG: hypothetical protein IJO81_02660 [Clostridia bacterium]|nr:hypothetical protein [Clostridia bacterium]